MKNKIISYAIIFIVLMTAINIDFTKFNTNEVQSNNIVVTEQIIENEEDLEKIEEPSIEPEVEEKTPAPVSTQVSKPAVTSRGSSTSSNGKVNLGTYTLTAYCACVKCCGKTDGITASGKKAVSGHTVAAPSSFPFGTKLEINGKIYTVEDRGGAIQGKRLDIYFDSHQEALNFGRRTATVYKLGN